MCYTAISCYFLHRMILLHFVSFVCASAHVLAGVFANPTMASLLLGSVGEFDPSSESFKAYLKRLDQFFVANDIGKCARKKLLSEDRTFKRLSKWLSPTKSRLKKLCKSNSNNCLNKLIQLRKNSQPYRPLLVEIELSNLLRGRFLARFRPVSSQQLLMLVFHAVILIM